MTGKWLVLLSTVVIIALCALYYRDHSRAVVNAGAAGEGGARFRGRLETEPRARLAFPVGGRLLSVEVHEGDEVGKGERLASLDDEQARRTLEEIDARLHEALARESSLAAEWARVSREVPIRERQAAAALGLALFEEEQTRRDSIRGAALRNDHLIAAVEMETLATRQAAYHQRTEYARAGLESAENDRAHVAVSRYALAEARSTVEAMRAKLRAASRALDDHRLLAPFRGVVLRRMREVGEVVPPGEPVVELANLDSLYFEADVPEVYVARLRLGQRLDVQLVAQPGRTLRGTVLRIDRASKETLKLNVLTEEEEDREYRVRVSLGSGGRGLALGLRGYAVLP
jgi:multidrug resistance efflux pump